MTPAEKCAEAVRQAVVAIEKIVARASTEEVAGQCFTFNLLRGQPGQPLDSSLLAPTKQCSFLLGLLLSSPEPASPKSFSKEDWNAVVALLNQAVSAYHLLFLPDSSSRDQPSQEWIRVRDVALPAFLDSFGSRVMGSGEQLADRVKRYVSPFDEQVKRVLGLSATEALAIAEWILADLQSTLDRMPEILREEEDARRSLLTEAKVKGWTLDDLRAAAARPEVKVKFEAYISNVRNLGIVGLPALTSKFPESALQFWNAFSVERGAGPKLDFPTEESIFDRRPLIRVSETEAIVPSASTLMAAILEEGERIMANTSIREKYFRTRDRTLEAESADNLTALLGGDASVYRNVFETVSSELEHDIVAVSARICLIAEAKASPPPEPFRDPDKAFARLRRDFRADTGIQTAYQQALRVWRRLAVGEDVPLYDKNGNEVVRIPASARENTFCVCVTRESHGLIATDLDLLLEKEATEPYPWAVSVLDLQTLAQAWKFLGWDDQKLRDYLRVRIQLHGKIFSSDELDFAGYFVRYGSLEKEAREGDFLFLGPDTSGVFDQIYEHLQYGTPPPDLTRPPPPLIDVRRSMAASREVRLTSLDRERGPRVGRNDPCPCGSQKKFKKCCGRVAQ